MAQLINKSNQFHLTGTRYTEVDLQGISKQKQNIVRYYKLRDRFGDNGLISVLVLTKSPQATLEIDTWVMSCRVLERTMEAFIANDVIDTAKRLGCHTILGRYVPSAKNRLVSLLYERLGLRELTTKMVQLFGNYRLKTIHNLPLHHPTIEGSPMTITTIKPRLQDIFRDVFDDDSIEIMTP